MAHVSLENQLKKLLKNKGISSLKLESGETIQSVLKSEANRLGELIQEEINNIYNEPMGSWYLRQWRFHKSLRVDTDIDPNTNTITISFDRGLAEHPSYFTQFNSSYNNPGYVPLLYNEGFKRLFGGDYFDGTHYIEAAIRKFNQNKRSGISIKLQKTYDGNTYFDKYM